MYFDYGAEIDVSVFEASVTKEVKSKLEALKPSSAPLEFSFAYFEPSAPGTPSYTQISIDFVTSTQALLVQHLATTGGLAFDTAAAQVQSAGDGSEHDYSQHLVAYGTNYAHVYTVELYFKVPHTRAPTVRNSSLFRSSVRNSLEVNVNALVPSSILAVSVVPGDEKDVITVKDDVVVVRTAITLRYSVAVGEVAELVRKWGVWILLPPGNAPDNVHSSIRYYAMLDTTDDEMEPTTTITSTTTTRRFGTWPNAFNSSITAAGNSDGLVDSMQGWTTMLPIIVDVTDTNKSATQSIPLILAAIVGIIIFFGCVGYYFLVAERKTRLDKSHINDSFRVLTASATRWSPDIAFDKFPQGRSARFSPQMALTNAPSQWGYMMQTPSRDHPQGNGVEDEWGGVDRVLWSTATNPMATAAGPSPLTPEDAVRGAAAFAAINSINPSIVYNQQDYLTMDGGSPQDYLSMEGSPLSPEYLAVTQYNTQTPCTTHSASTGQSPGYIAINVEDSPEYLAFNQDVLQRERTKRNNPDNAPRTPPPPAATVWFGDTPSEKSFSTVGSPAGVNVARNILEESWMGGTTMGNGAMDAADAPDYLSTGTASPLPHIANRRSTAFELEALQMPSFMGLFVPADEEGDTFLLDKEKVRSLESSGQLDGLPQTMRNQIEFILAADRHLFTEDEVMSFSMEIDKAMSSIPASERFVHTYANTVAHSIITEEPEEDAAGGAAQAYAVAANDTLLAMLSPKGDGIVDESATMVHRDGLVAIDNIEHDLEPPTTSEMTLLTNPHYMMQTPSVDYGASATLSGGLLPHVANRRATALELEELQMPGFMGLFTPDTTNGNTFVLERGKVLELEASGQLDGITPAVRATIDAILAAEKHVFTEDEVMTFSMEMDKIMTRVAPMPVSPGNDAGVPRDAPTTGIREGNVDARRTIWSPDRAPPALGDSGEFATSSSSIGHYYPPAGFEG